MSPRGKSGMVHVVVTCDGEPVDVEGRIVAIDVCQQMSDEHLDRLRTAAIELVEHLPDDHAVSLEQLEELDWEGSVVGGNGHVLADAYTLTATEALRRLGRTCELLRLLATPILGPDGQVLPGAETIGALMLDGEG